MKRLLKYIPLHMKDDFLKYAYEHHRLSPDKIESAVQLELIAGEYLFKNKKGEDNKETKVKTKTEEEVFVDICDKKFGDISWEKITELVHSEVKIPDSVIPVFALDVMCGDKLEKRLVMRDYDKSLRFMDHVRSIWLHPVEQPR